jgi:nucleoside-diphosphate-sugar epimerase
MRIVVTGGAGYLGSILCGRLLEEGHKVKCLDNLLYGKEPIKPLLRNSNFQLITGDIRDMTTITTTINGADTVIHLASIVGRQAANLNSKATKEINYLATKNIAELCALHNIKNLIFASTCSVYGAQPNNLIDEHSPTRPADLYAETKIKSEAAILDVFANAAILRTATLFGLSKRMRFDLAINRFIAQAIQDKMLTVFGGQQYRPFIHVADATEAYLFVLDNELKGIYNISWKNWKIIDVAKLISDTLGAEIEVSKKIVDLRDYKVHCDKIKSLGFNPKRNVQMAIEDISERYESEFKDYRLPKYDNYGTIFNSKDVQSKIYTRGPIWK